MKIYLLHHMKEEAYILDCLFYVHFGGAGLRCKKESNTWFFW